MNSRDITKKMLTVIRENQNKKTTLLTEEDTTTSTKKEFPITSKTPQFADVRASQIEKIIQTVGENIDFEDNALIFYPSNKDMTLTGNITSLNLMFQFRYADRSGYGCYILQANSVPLTDNNYRTIGKLKDAYENWRASLTSDGDLMKRLFDAANQ
jgi:hypothetical protein